MISILSSQISIIPLISIISVGLRMNEAAMKSKLCSIPKIISLTSCSVTAGSDVFTPIIFTFFLLPISEPFRIIQWILLSITFSTSRSTRPSAIRICFPGLISDGNFLYEILRRLSEPSTSSVVNIIVFP